jgi:ubiquinone/menaquinone biosynthesis C-methylase UbiE
MTDPIKRFSSRVDDYVKYRPGYPREIVNLLASECALTPASVIADIGSGTGLLSELFLRHGNMLYGVEPNSEMRAAAAQLLNGYLNFTSVDGKAEATSLSDNSVDFVIAGQAFHWFNQEEARQEFARILESKGWVALIWNERRLGSSEFLRAYEELFLKYGTDYAHVRHENVYEDIASFFAPHGFRVTTFDNFQTFDFQGLKGRALSASYTPEPGHAGYEPMLEQLRAIFSTHQKSGRVTIEYDTRIYYGQLSNQPNQ